VRAIRSGSEQSAIVAFNSCHSELKEAIKRAAQLNQDLNEPALYDLKRAREINIGSYFSGGIENEEQLTASLNALRDDCLRHLGAGKRVLIQ
jgi:hypothetical protein